MAGSVKGSAEVSGETYLTAQYGFNVQFLWRDFGIILVMWFLYVAVTALGLSIMNREKTTSNARVYLRGAKRYGHGSSSEDRDLEGQQATTVATPTPSSPESASRSSLSTTGRDAKPTYRFALEPTHVFLPQCELLCSFRWAGASLAQQCYGICQARSTNRSNGRFRGGKDDTVGNYLLPQSQRKNRRNPSI